MVVLVPESLDNLVTTGEAADACGVGASTISMWAKRGHLAPTGLDERGHPLYKLIDVLRAARNTRQNAIGRNRIA